VAEIAVRLVIEGRVQGVGFRYWTVEQAKEFKLTGWVRNRRDGTVEALVSGDEVAVKAMIAACAKGPLGARVAAVKQFPAAPPDEPGFRQRLTE